MPCKSTYGLSWLLVWCLSFVFASEKICSFLLVHARFIVKLRTPYLDHQRCSYRAEVQFDSLLLVPFV